MNGLVSLVGAGPGDPELLTLRALRRLAEADVVLHDALIDPRLLALAPRARLLDVGKRARGQGGRAADQRVIEQLLVRLGRRGLRVVRLKGGDPYVFGRGGEEALALLRAGLPFEVVPGVSSALAAPALAGVPVTHRGLASAFVVVSGHDLDGAAALLRGLPPGGATIVLLMARGRRGELAAILRAAGWPAETPAAAIERASLPDQRTWRGPLADLGAAPLDEEAPVVLVIGPTVALGAALLKEVALAA